MRVRREPCAVSRIVLALLSAAPLGAQQIPQLPDPSGWGVHVLALARAPDSSIWVGSYGQGIFVLKKGAGSWEQYRASTDPAARSISWDFVHAFAFGASGEIWYGTVGNGWGLSTDRGKTWTNWQVSELGPEWQYVAPNGIVVRGDTVYVATADGIKLSGDRGATWAEITDSAGATAARRVWGRIADQYVLAITVGPRGSLWIGHRRGIARSLDGGRTWQEFATPAPGMGDRFNRARALAADTADVLLVGTEQGILLVDPEHRARPQPAPLYNPCGTIYTSERCGVTNPEIQQLLVAGEKSVVAAAAEGVVFHHAGRLDTLADPRAGFATAILPLGVDRFLVGTPAGLREVRAAHRPAPPQPRRVRAPDAERPARPKHTWFRRPIALEGQPYIDQTYRYGSTMGGNFQQHQGVEFNNGDGTPVHAIGDGVVAFAGPAEAGALTVAIKHDRRLSVTPGHGPGVNPPLYLFSVYYHNSKLLVQVGDRVKAGDVISLVGNTGRATNDHLHLEVHAAPSDSVQLIVDPAVRHPPHTTNPELWIEPLPGTGLVAGQVWDSRGRPVEQARIYGLVKGEPQETPFSFVETYGARAHPSPLYLEHFAITDVRPGEYVLDVEIEGQRVYRRVRVDAGKLTWVEFRP